MNDTMEKTFTPKIYMVDTNVFRYHAYKIGDTSNNEEVKRKKYRDEARTFFEMAFNEAQSKKALLMVSDETVHELSVQAYTLKNESKTYKRVLKHFSVENTEVPKSLEYMLRDFSNYIRGKFGSELVEEGRKTDYLRTSDARILVHAYLNDAILVTNNTKDFFFYSLFFEPTEDDVLYDIMTKKYVKILNSTKTQLLSDSKFIDLQKEMKNLKY